MSDLKSKASEKLIKDDYKVSVKIMSCPVCSAVIKQRNKFLDHLRLDHYYEALEDLLVAKWAESTICCKINFNNSGFGQFVRHKVLKHKAIEDLPDIDEDVSSILNSSQLSIESDVSELVVQEDRSSSLKFVVDKEKPLHVLKFKEFAKNCANSKNINSE